MTLVNYSVLTGSTPVYLCVRPLVSQPVFYMTLHTGYDDWQKLLAKIGIPNDSVRTYAETFVSQPWRCPWCSR